ncbi:MAG TPA: TatD family hydrolase [Candidatus Udaeobacter sp.]|jgi:TatD DNase family protein|nr:TatD family hydrolase [Candidatus Udaeobacter sp.]
MIDTHCHLADKRFDKDREPVLQRALDAGVTHLIEIAYAPAIVPRAHDIARRHPGVYLCVGVHPSESAKTPHTYLDDLRDHARHPRVVAIGETGLDFFRDYAPREDQLRWFRAQLALSAELGLPVVIHQRSALDETLATLEEAGLEAGGVLHCFDDGPAAAARARAIGFKLGLGGCLTYGHAELDDAVRQAPEDQLVLETDAPYLEPEPRSLRRNEPALILRVAKRLAELRGWTMDEVDRITSANARALFRAPLGV